MDILESCINFKAISDFSNIWFDVCFAGSVKILERIVMFKKRILFIILACLAFFCMVPVKAQNAAFSQPEKGISLEEMTEKAEKGDTDAQYFLGMFYLSVVEEGKNQQKAVYWLQKAADGGNAEAQLRLGMMYAMGEKIPKDEKKAVSLVMQSAEQGFPVAQFLLYCGYSEHEEDRQKYLRIKQQLDEDIRYFFDGILAFASAMRKQGITSDTQKAIDWLQKAAEQGLASAQNDLAIVYITGDGVPRNYRKAFEWTRKAARQGYPDALFNLGLMYVNGHGIEKNYLFAYVLFNQVAVTLDSARELLDRLEARMMPWEIVKAQAMTIDDVLK